MTDIWKATRCACGCGQIVAPKTANRPARYIHGHNPVVRHRSSLKERFWAKVIKSDDCWLWVGTKSKGYGRIWDTDLRRHRRATEVSLMLTGVEIPEKAMICHHCDVPSCVRPSHLYVGDATSNERDKIARGRRPKMGGALPGEANHQAKLSDADVAAIRAQYGGGRGEQSALARQYDVTPQLIHLIVGGKYRV